MHNLPPKINVKNTVVRNVFISIFRIIEYLLNANIVGKSMRFILAEMMGDINFVAKSVKLVGKKQLENHLQVKSD